MRTLWISIVSAALLGGAACRSAEEKAQGGFEKTQEEVREQGQGVKDEMKGVTGEEKQVPQEQQMEGNIAQDRATYTAQARERLTKIDAQLTELEASPDQATQQKAKELRGQRDELAASLDKAGEMTEANWDQFKKDTDTKFEQIEKDIQDAMR